MVCERTILGAKCKNNIPPYRRIILIMVKLHHINGKSICPVGQSRRAANLVTQIWFLIFRHKTLGRKKKIPISTVTSSGQVLKWLSQKETQL